ncbi:Uncharacterised protein [Edwardsiella tarda]|nr:Uncharacterised protein [Edwardsiella tarda]
MNGYKLIKTMPGIIIILLSSISLSGCGDSSEREFIRGCKAGGGTTALCSCIFDNLKSVYTSDELEKINQQYGYAPPHFMENMLVAAQRCKNKGG